jgi:hypothetical protein
MREKIKGVIEPVIKAKLEAELFILDIYESSTDDATVSRCKTFLTMRGWLGDNNEN